MLMVPSTIEILLMIIKKEGEHWYTKMELIRHRLVKLRISTIDFILSLITCNYTKITFIYMCLFVVKISLCLKLA